MDPHQLLCPRTQPKSVVHVHNVVIQPSTLVSVLHCSSWIWAPFQLCRPIHPSASCGIEIHNSSSVWVDCLISDRQFALSLCLEIEPLFAIVSGVPQGSLLGPFFFILYTSNITDIASRHGILIHISSDDTQLYLHKTIYLRHWKREGQTRAMLRWNYNPDVHRATQTVCHQIWTHGFITKWKTTNRLSLGKSTNICLIEPWNVVHDLGVSHGQQTFDDSSHLVCHKILFRLSAMKYDK